MLRRGMLLFALVVSLGACGGEAEEDAAPAAIDGPMTTETTATAAPPVSTATFEPATNPTATVTAEPTEAPTATEEPTVMAVSTATVEASIASPVVASQSNARPLKVSFTNLNYECERNCMRQGRPPLQSMWGYYKLQVLMQVENISTDKTLDPPWMVSRWVITDGAKSWDETYAWQWTRDSGEGFHGQPSIPPGGKGEWTWMGFPIPYGAWVGAIEYKDPWGNTYRQNLAKPAFGEHNYQDCGPPFGGGC